jgi:hypothetical protein
MTNPPPSRRIALFLANPDPARALAIEHEWYRIDSAIRRSPHRHALELVDFQRPTREHLHNAVLEGFDVIHIASHGQKNGFELHGLHAPELISLDEFSQLVSSHSPRDRPVQCVLLNACWSSEIGTRRALRVPFTIAMHEEIADESALEFSAGFYDALGASHDYEHCYRHGRLRVLDTHFRAILLQRHTGALGIRSYVLDAEDIEEQTESSLMLESCFDGRFPNPPHTWSSIAREIAAFCQDPILRHRFRNERFRIHLACHLSIALVAGHLLGFAAPVAPLQGRHDKQLWQRSGQASAPAVLGVRKRGRIEASEIAVSLSITHDIMDDVEAYLRSRGIDCQLIDIALPCPGPLGITGAEHADAVADALMRQLRAARGGRPDRMIHLFLAVPVALAFLLGQYQHALGRLQVYEFDFDHRATSSYSPSFVLPLPG